MSIKRAMLLQGRVESMQQSATPKNRGCRDGCGRLIALSPSIVGCSQPHLDLLCLAQFHPYILL